MKKMYAEQICFMFLHHYAYMNGTFGKALQYVWCGIFMSARSIQNSKFAKNACGIAVLQYGSHQSCLDELRLQMVNEFDTVLASSALVPSLKAYTLFNP
jgi:hypothetical protein